MRAQRAERQVRPALKKTSGANPQGCQLFRLHGEEELIRGLRQVLRHNKCQDERVFFRLHGAGLVHREGDKVLPRCQLYADYFWRPLHV